MYRIIPCTIGTPESDEGELASFTMTAQIRLLVCKELRSVETQVFSALDNLVYDQVNIGRENPLAVWACLWTLLFIYKDHMIYTRSTLPEYDISPMIRKFHKEVLHLGSLRFTDSESRCLKISAKSASVQYLDVGICSAVQQHIASYAGLANRRYIFSPRSRSRTHQAILRHKNRNVLVL